MEHRYAVGRLMHEAVFSLEANSRRLLRLHKTPASLEKNGLNF